jgi:hypothetical protein
MANARPYPFWGHLTEALRTGQPQNEVKTGGPGLFETLYADPARLKAFLAAMTGLSRGANMMIARIFPWKNYHTFVDVSAGVVEAPRRLDQHVQAHHQAMPETARSPDLTTERQRVVPARFPAIRFSQPKPEYGTSSIRAHC